MLLDLEIQMLSYLIVYLMMNNLRNSSFAKLANNSDLEKYLRVKQYKSASCEQENTQKLALSFKSVQSSLLTSQS